MVAALVLAGCADSKPSAGTRADEPPLVFIDTVEVGGALADGPYAFGSVTAAAVLADGERWALADGTAQEVHLFSLAGSHLRVVGRRGGGPGEHRALHGIGARSDGGFCTWDAVSTRVTHFAREGEVVSTATADLAEMQSILPEFVGFFPDCSFVLLDKPPTMGMRVLPEGMRRDTIRLALFSAGGSMERILLHDETPDYWFRNRGDSWARVRPIFGEEVVAFVRGDELWVGRTGELSWSRIALNGTDRGRAALEFVPRSASDAQIERERTRRVEAVRTWGGRTPTGPNDAIWIAAGNERRGIREVAVRRTMPQYDMVVVGLDRSLWVRRFPAPEETTATWLLLDSALVSVGSTTMSRDDVVVAGSLDVAVVKSVDSIGAPVVRLLRRR